MDSVPLLKVLGKDARAELEGLFHTVHFEKGSVVMTQGDTTDDESCMYLLHGICMSHEPFNLPLFWGPFMDIYSPCM